MAGDIDAAKKDVSGLLPEHLRDRLSVDEKTNKVSFNSDGLSDADANDEGVMLLKNLVGASENYQYSVSDVAPVNVQGKPIGNETFEVKPGMVDLLDKKENGVMNVSKTPMNVKELQAEYTPSNSKNDAEVTISKNKEICETVIPATKTNASREGTKSRGATVFHNIKARV